MGYKLKTHSSAKKRFKKTGSGLKRRSANRSHILTSKPLREKGTIEGLLRCKMKLKKLHLSF